MTTKEESAKELVEWHDEVEPYLTKVIRFFDVDAAKEADAKEPIKLLEVNSSTVTTGSVEPYTFAPTADLPFWVTIAEVTPEEYERILKKEIELPRTWSLAKQEVILDRPEKAA